MHLLRLLMTLGGLLWASWALGQTQAVGQAGFRSAPTEEWASVTLPDTRNATGAGQYRFAFTLPADAAALRWAFWTTRLSTAHGIWLNGSPLVVPPASGEQVVLTRPRPAFVEMPPALLRAGSNEVVVDIRCPSRCGMGTLLVGPADVLLQRHLRHETLWVTLPQALNTATVALAVFMLVIWWRRPQERTIGIFALLWLPTWVRCYSYFISYVAVPPAAFEALFFAINLATAPLLLLFALELCGRQAPRLRGALWATCVLAPVLALASGLLDVTREVRAVVYPVLLLLLAYTVAVLWVEYRKQKSPGQLLLLLSTATLTACAVHDVMYLRGLVPIDDFFWTPWAGPVFFVSFAGLLLGRLVRALNDAEELTVSLEKRVAQRTAELQDAHAAQVHFIAAASHDLRQPLHTLGLLLGMLRPHLHAAPSVGILARIDANVESMDNLLHGILDLSRLNANAVVPRVAAIPLAELWTRTERSFAVEAGRLGLRLCLHPTQLWVASDPDLLQRCLNNMVSNALRYTPRGGVLIGARARGAQCVIEVWDTGVGIAPDRLDDIFMEFVQLGDVGSAAHRGLGLGLAIVHRTAALLGHGLNVQSRVGRGSVFRMVLPRVSVPAAGAAGNPADPSLDAEGLFVLVVDDSSESLFATQGLLASWGCLTAVAVAADPALATLDGRLRLPDAAILDYRMPGGDGLALAQRLRDTLGVALPTLIVTGDVSAAALQAIGSSGHACMHKPADPKALRAWLAGVKRALADDSPDGKAHIGSDPGAPS